MKHDLHSNLCKHTFTNTFRVLKDLQNWKEAPLDCMALSLYQLQSFYCNEIKRGVAGLGEYTIASEFSGMKIEEIDSAMCHTVSLEEIVTHIKHGLQERVHVQQLPTPSIGDTCTDFNTSNMSSEARAQAVLKAGNITFDSKLHCFLVKGTSGIVRVVTLFPKETCSCPSMGHCYHLLATRLSVGITEPKKNVRHNLTQLRKNTRGRNDKKSGRKRPRPNDEHPG